jgi:hypothetical protein
MYLPSTDLPQQSPPHDLSLQPAAQRGSSEPAPDIVRAKNASLRIGNDD